MDDETDAAPFELFADVIGDNIPESALDSVYATFHEALFEGSTPGAADAYLDLLAIMDHYGIDFADEFDWEGYQEWYNSQ